MIHAFTYDGSWEGLCTCIFSAYEYKRPDVLILEEGKQSPPLFGESQFLEVDGEKAQRVINGLKKKCGRATVQSAYCVFLSEMPWKENLILRYVQYLMSTKGGERNFANKYVLEVQQIEKKVSREQHRMKAFVRFKKGNDGLFYCGIEPDYNVLPLVAKHFKDRYADQKWLIYDTKRKYGLYYDLKTVEEVQLTIQPSHSVSPLDFAADEDMYQILWQQYFKSVNIAERKNTKLHLQHVPKRYWKYLPEKLG